MSFPNQQGINEVKAFFANLSDAEVLMFCCNLNRDQYPNAPPLAACAVVVCLDTEGWDADSNALKEVGVNTFESRDMTANASPGPWGENILNKVYFYFARVQKHAHLRNKNFSAGHPDTNRFGLQRFLTDDEMVNFLTSAFEWPLDADAEDGRVCPVVLLGHALQNDVGKVEKLLGFTARNVVREVDTQAIARQVGHWNHPSNDIGLQRLVGNMGFAFRDPHTASNDAAYTTISAIQLIIDAAFKGTGHPRTLQSVIDNLERMSKYHVWSHGEEKYCFRCGHHGHCEHNGGPNGGRCLKRVYCDWCFEHHPKAHRGHRTAVCVMKAFESSNSSRPGRRHRKRGGPGVAGEGRNQGVQDATALVANDFPQLPPADGPSFNARKHPDVARTQLLKPAGQRLRGILPPVQPGRRQHPGFVPPPALPCLKAAGQTLQSGCPPISAGAAFTLSKKVRPRRPRAGNVPGQAPRSAVGQPQRKRNNNNRRREHSNPFEDPVRLDRNNEG
ncbi:hypothetical protein PMIN06_007596 [Paraphaeosphaeria minitans]